MFDIFDKLDPLKGTILSIYSIIHCLDSPIKKLQLKESALLLYNDLLSTGEHVKVLKLLADTKNSSTKMKFKSLLNKFSITHDHLSINILLAALKRLGFTFDTLV